MFILNKAIIPLWFFSIQSNFQFSYQETYISSNKLILKISLNPNFFSKL